MRIGRTGLKTMLLIAALAFGGPALAARVAMLGVSSGLLLYGALFLLLLAALWGAAFIARDWLRWGWAALFTLAGLFVDSFQTATADAMSYDAFVTMVQSAAFAGDALAQHGGEMAWASAGALLLLFAIGLRPGDPRPLPAWLAVLAPVAGLAMLSLLLYARGGEGGRGLPGAWIGTSYALLYGWEAVVDPAPSRAAVGLVPRQGAAPGDIVLIIDESVAARYLDINDPAGVRSGLAQPPQGVRIANFGVAASVTNCSYGSNMTLRHGGTRPDYRRINAAMPSLFAYARRAGFATAYIDAQRTDGAYQNGMDDAERRNIDRFIQFAAVPVVDRDRAAAAALAALLHNGRRDFVIVNKMGAHFPVADKYPADAMRYRPALARGAAVAVAETQLPENLYSGAESWRRYRNSYRNTLEWTVGGFFDRLFAAGLPENALIVYTSDHGQTLHERGDAGTTTHCSPDPAPEEGAVPLVVIDGKGRWAGAARRGFDASSHYRIAPTLLAAMGYDRAAVTRIYGPGLDAAVRDPMTFNARFNARLGRGPLWVAIRPGALPAPSTEDYLPATPH